ncbi:MAG: hypothetical protein KDN22_11430 [Verrucomicrobiae bacterium]|nr:hypothetical protein [Verrucomicrobiae bacterium]
MIAFHHYSHLTTIVHTLVLGTLAATLSMGEEEKKTRDQMVLEDRSALADNDHWIYNDLDKAFAEAEQSGRPLMVVHRCIP